MHTVTKIKIGDREISNNQKIANHFNDYFCNIASKLKNEIKTDVFNDSEAMQYLACNCNSICKCNQASIFIEPCHESEILGIINNLKTYHRLIIAQTC